MKRLIAWILSASAPLWTWCFASEPCLGMRISTAKGTFQSGRPISIRIDFKNVCRSAVVVLDPQFEKGLGYGCEIADSAGKAVIGPVDDMVRHRDYSWLDVTRHQRVLVPGKKYSFQGELTTLTEWVRLLAPGTYSVQCSYACPEEDRLKATPLGNKMWYGTVRSNTIRIKVQP